MLTRRRQHGLTLIEFALALVVAAIVVGALDSLVGLALRARSAGRSDNELVYQGRFAMERMVAKARATAPKVLTVPALPNTTSDWFWPTMYCLKGGNRLVETTYSDTSCTGANVIADNVTALSVQLPSGAGPFDEPAATLTLTLSAGSTPLTLTTTVRLGGGAL